MIERIQLLRNVGQFDSVSAGAQIPLTKLTLIYAENGRGKTTLASILRSLGTGDPVPIIERRRLAAANPPHLVIVPAGGQPAIVFQNGAWSQSFLNIAVFDDQFVTSNVHAGLVVDTEQRQNLHELILGARGVAINQSLQTHVDRIEEHNRSLRTKAEAIPARVRGAFSLDTFCKLKQRADIESAIQEAQRSLAAAQSADAVRNRLTFEPITLPEFDIVGITALLRRDLPELAAAAAKYVQAHLTSLGAGGEAWVAEGVKRIAPAAAAGQEICPLCAQKLDGSPLIAHYRAYFSAAYEDLKQVIAKELADFRSKHSGEVVAAFERSIRVATELRQFWSQFAEVPQINLDTAAIARAWKAAQQPLLEALRAKQAAPLEPLALPAGTDTAIATYQKLRNEVMALSARLQTTNAQIAIVKEKAAVANIAALTADLAQLQAIHSRYRSDIATLCDDYLAEKAAKASTERLRDQARTALDDYRTTVFPAYEVAINNYLKRFNAGFRLTQVKSANTRAGSACVYNVLINTVSVPLAPGSTPGPSFRSTLSAGDRNTLALAFFFASLERDPQADQKIVVIDDPITSLDEHRALTTVQEMRRLVAMVRQIMVLSHTKPFLCQLWQGADITTRTAIKLDRDGAGSTLSPWDVNQDCITEHDRRHALVSDYVRSTNAVDQRAVAAALRPMLESFMRVAYPEAFQPNTLLGPFINTCQQRVGTADEMLSSHDTAELRDILDYANLFHHDTNMAWQTVIINDGELLNFCKRVIKFTRRGHII